MYIVCRFISDTVRNRIPRFSLAYLSAHWYSIPFQWSPPSCSCPPQIRHHTRRLGNPRRVREGGSDRVFNRRCLIHLSNRISSLLSYPAASWLAAWLAGCLLPAPCLLPPACSRWQCNCRGKLKFCSPYIGQMIFGQPRDTHRGRGRAGTREKPFPVEWLASRAGQRGRAEGEAARPGKTWDIKLLRM